jgi:predicted RNA methylase
MSALGGGVAGGLISAGGMFAGPGGATDVAQPQPPILGEGGLPIQEQAIKETEDVTESQRRLQGVQLPQEQARRAQQEAVEQEQGPGATPGGEGEQEVAKVPVSKRRQALQAYRENLPNATEKEIVEAMIQDGLRPPVELLKKYPDLPGVKEILAEDRTVRIAGQAAKAPAKPAEGKARIQPKVGAGEIKPKTAIEKEKPTLEAKKPESKAPAKEVGIKAYHGTRADIDTFRPLSHFGTEKAAAQALESVKGKGEAKIISAELTLKNPLEVKDTVGTTEDVVDWIWQAEEKGIVTEKEAVAIEDIVTETGEIKEAEKAFVKLLKSKGYDGLKYINKTEDKGSLSYIIVDPKQVKQAKPAEGKEGRAEEKKPDAQLSKKVVEHLSAGKSLDAKTFFAMADEAYGGTRAEGKYGPSDVYDVLEAAVNEYSKKPGLSPSQDLGIAVDVQKWFEELLDRLPSQTNRSGEKDLMQQFSTPPHYAYAVAWVANIGENDVVLEPSAGTGGLAVHALNAKPAKVYVNELSQRRAKLLEKLGFDKVFTEDAEQIHNILPEENRPNVVLMNPPFSHAAHRMGAKTVYGTDLRHIEAALSYLKDNGRLVAVMGRPLHEDKGESKNFQNWIDRIGKTYNVRANVYVNRHGCL